MNRCLWHDFSRKRSKIALIFISANWLTILWYSMVIQYYTAIKMNELELHVIDLKTYDDPKSKLQVVCTV